MSATNRGVSADAESTLIGAWTRTVAADPAAVALIDAVTGRRWTRSEIDAAADQWAAEHGPTVVGKIIAIAESNGPEWLRVFLGALRSTGIVAPLDPGEPADAQVGTARAIGASVLWRSGHFLPLAPETRARKVRGRLIKLTSGSTGAPRPLFFTDTEMLADGRHICAGMEIGPEDLNVGLIPWGHSYGLGNLIMPLLLQGTAIAYGASPLPHAIAAEVERWRATVFPAVPAILRALAESSVPPEQLRSLRTVISAGAPLMPEVAAAFHERFGLKVHSFYGSTETGGITYDRTGDSALTARGVGQPLPEVKLEFTRGDRFTVSSDAVFTLGNRHPGSHRPGDLARRDDSGELVLLGRAGRFVKIAGRRLNLVEVEQALKQIPSVRDALVTAHAERADALAAAVASDQAGAEIRDALRLKLAPWKIPKKILVLPSFPLTSRGKTDARQLRALLGAETAG